MWAQCSCLMNSAHPLPPLLFLPPLPSAPSAPRAREAKHRRERELRQGGEDAGKPLGYAFRGRNLGGTRRSFSIRGARHGHLRPRRGRRRQLAFFLLLLLPDGLRQGAGGALAGRRVHELRREGKRRGEGEGGAHARTPPLDQQNHTHHTQFSKLKVFRVQLNSVCTT